VVAEVALAVGGSAAGGSPTTEVVWLVVAFASVLGAVVTSIVFAVRGRAANVPGDILAERSPTDLAEALERAAELEEWPTELLP